MIGPRLFRMMALAGVILAGAGMALPVQGFSLGIRDAGKGEAPAQVAPKDPVPVQPALLPAGSAADARYESAVSGQIVEVRGRVRLVGSDPFPNMVLTDDGDNTWYIDPADRKTLSSCEQQTVTIRGVVELKEMVLANGRSLGSRRILSGVTLVKVG
jgi:hypothetical protein